MKQIEVNLQRACRCIERHLVVAPPGQLPPVVGLQQGHIENLARHLVTVILRPGLPPATDRP